MSFTLTRKAADKKTGMSFADLTATVREAEAAGLGPDSAVKVTAGFRQQIQSLEIKTKEQ